MMAIVNITDGKTANNKGAYDIPLLKGSVVDADRYYNDFSWDSTEVFFVIRHIENLQYTRIGELPLPEKDTIMYLLMKLLN